MAADQAAAEAMSVAATVATSSAPAPEADSRQQRRDERRRAREARARARAEAKAGRREARLRARAEEQQTKAEQAPAADESDRDAPTVTIAALPADPPADQETSTLPAVSDSSPQDERRKREDAAGAADDPLVPAPPSVPAVARSEKTTNRRELVAVALVAVGALGLLCSVVLAVGALLAAVEVDVDASFARAIGSTCDVLVGPLGGLISFSGEDAETRNELFTRGVGSMLYLAVGLVLPSLARRDDA